MRAEYPGQAFRLCEVGEPGLYSLAIPLLAPGKEGSIVKKVVIMGFGSSGQRFSETVRAHDPEVDLLVFSSQELAGLPFPATKSLSTLRDFEPDVAIVCGAPSERLDAVNSLPDSVTAVLVEKPLAMNFSQGMELRHLLQKRNQTVQVGYNLRFSPSLRDFKRRTDAGEFGAVVSVRAETGHFLPNWRPGRDYRTTVSSQSIAGGGVLRELSHEVDYLQWIFGEIEWVSAWCGRQSELEIDVEDSAHLTLGFANPDRHKALVGQLNLDFVRHDNTRTVTAICAEGSLRWDGTSNEVHCWRAGESGWDLVFSETRLGTSTYDLQWESFRLSIDDLEPVQVSLDDGLAVLGVLDAAQASNAMGGTKVATRQGAISK